METALCKGQEANRGRVQSRAIRLVECVNDLRNKERLKLLGLMRLDSHRDISNLIENFKILNGNYSVNRDFFLYNGRDTPGNYKKTV